MFATHYKKMFVQSAISILGDWDGNADHLRELELALDKIVPFVGAGLSAPFGYPRWGRFLEGLCSTPEASATVHELIAANQFEEAAEALEQTLGARFNEAIRETMGEERLPTPLPDAAVMRLPRIARGPVLTTNFDPVLEVAFRLAGRPFSGVFAGDQIKDASYGLQFRQQFLLKLHGDYRSPFSRVLTLSEYNRAYGGSLPGEIQWSRPLPKVLRQAITGNAVLFLGCSLVKDRTTAIIAGAASELPGIRQFALLSLAENTSERREQLRQWRILPLFYPADHYEKVGDFLDCVVTALNPKPSAPIDWGRRYLTSFVGRDEEMREAIARLKGRDRLITITGPAGSGKTRFARELLEHVAGDFPGGAFFVGLEDLAQHTLVLSTIAEKVGLPQRSGDAPSDRSLAIDLKEYLRPLEILLVLDNFEHVIPAAVPVVELISACERLRVLVTSRERLNVQLESEFVLGPLSLPPSDQVTDVESIRRHSAVELFVARARAGSPEFQITTANARSVLEICWRLDGLPLAIELAAAKLRSNSLQWLSDQLDQRLMFLTRGPRDNPQRQRTMQNAISWSYDLLTPFEKAIFRKLSVFAGSFDPSSAKEVAHMTAGDLLEPGIFKASCYPASPNEIAETGEEDLLESLADKSMLQREHFDAAPRYKMLGIIQEYAYERLKDREEADEIESRYMWHFAFAANAHLGRLRQSDERQARAWILREIPNLRAVLDRSLQTDPNLGLQLSMLLKPYWLDMGNITEGRERLAELIKASEPTVTVLGKKEPRPSWFSSILEQFDEREPPRSDGLWIEGPNFWRTEGLQLAAALASVQSDHDAARTYLQELKDLGEKFGDERLVQTASFPLAVLTNRQKGLDESVAFERLRENIKHIDHEQGDARGLMIEAATAMRRKDFVVARSLLQRAHDSVPPNNENLRIGLLVGLAHIAELEGKSAEAITLCARAEDDADQTGVAILRATTLLMTARIYEGLGRLSDAKARYEDALGFAEEAGNMWATASAAQKLGENALRLRKYREAKERFAHVEVIGRQLGSPQFVGDAILGMSRADIGLGLMPKRLPEALEHFRKAKATLGEALCLMLLGEGKLNMAKYEEALKTFEQARSAFEKIGDVAGVANSIIRIGHTYRERAEYEEAEKKYQEAEAIYRSNRLDGGVISSLRARGDLYKRQRRFDEAQKHYSEALKFAQDAKDPQAEANLLLALGDLYMDTKQ